MGLSLLSGIFKIGIKSVSSGAQEAVVPPICVVSGLLALNRNNSFALYKHRIDTSFFFFFFSKGPYKTMIQLR